MGIAKCALFGDRRENKRETRRVRTGPPGSIRLRCAVRGPPVTVLRICNFPFPCTFEIFTVPWNIESAGIDNCFCEIIISKKFNYYIIAIHYSPFWLIERFTVRVFPFRHNNFEIYIRHRADNLYSTLLAEHVPLLTGDQTYMYVWIRGIYIRMLVTHYLYRGEGDGGTRAWCETSFLTTRRLTVRPLLRFSSWLVPVKTSSGVEHLSALTLRSKRRDSPFVGLHANRSRNV